MFDDNIEEGRPGSYGAEGDNLSIKSSCSVYLRTRTRESVPLRDNGQIQKKQLEIGDIAEISWAFESVIKTYYEHLFLFKNDKFRSEKLFPDLSLSELNEQFGIENPMSEEFENHFFHFAFLELNQNPHNIYV